MDGEEVVQLYVSDVKSSVPAPLFSLDGMKRVKLKKGESQQVTFDVTPRMMELVNENGDRVIEKGEFKVTIGGCSPVSVGQKLGAAPTVSTTFIVK